MAKPKSVSSARAKQIAKNAEAFLKDYDDSTIDFSDIPELTDKQLKEFRPIGRPFAEFVKQMIAIRLDPKLLKKLKKEASHQGIGYQTLIQQILAKHFEKKKSA